MLLVSGPSGSGKSTFIRLLQDQSLSAQIRSFLPADAGDWPCVEANNVLKGDQTFESVQQLMHTQPGIVLHYDIVFIHCRGMKRYEDDPAFPLLKGSEGLDIVFIKPEAKLLLNQYWERKNAHEGRKSMFSRNWAKFVRLPLRRLKAKLKGRSITTMEELYAMDGWLPWCYGEWEATVRRLLAPRSGNRMVVIEPAESKGSSPSFRLTQCIEADG